EPTPARGCSGGAGHNALRLSGEGGRAGRGESAEACCPARSCPLRLPPPHRRPSNVPAGRRISNSSFVSLRVSIPKDQESSLSWIADEDVPVLIGRGAVGGGRRRDRPEQRQHALS